MRKTIVVYRSKSGFTKKYAELIAKETGADIAEGKVRLSRLQLYDTVVFGGGLYISGIGGAGFIQRCIDALSGKRIIVFAQGASPLREGIEDEIRDKNFSAEQQSKIQFFLLRGGFDFAKLPPFYKVLMSLMKRRLQRTKEPTADERGMLAAYDTPVDFVSEKMAAPVIEAIKEA